MVDGLKGMSFEDFSARIPQVARFDLKDEDLSVFPVKVAKELKDLSKTGQQISYSRDNLERVWNALLQTAREDARDVPKAGGATLQPPQAGRFGVQLHGDDRLSGPSVEMLIAMFVRTD